MPNDPYTLTRRQLHAGLYKSKSINEAAQKLDVKYDVFAKFLRRNKINYENWRQRPVESMIQEFGADFDKTIPKISFVSIETLTPKQIYLGINSSANVTQAAQILNVDRDLFGEFLLTAPFKFEDWQSQDEVTVRKQYKGNFDQPIQIENIDLDSLPVRKIHQAIRNNKDTTDAAKELKVTHRAFKTFLGMHQINFARWHKTKPEILSKEFEDFDKPMPKADEATHRLAQYSLAAIHAVILSNKTLNEMSDQLGVLQGTLENHIERMTYQGHSLSIKELKSLSPEDFCKPLNELQQNDYYLAPSVVFFNPEVLKKGRIYNKEIIENYEKSAPLPFFDAKRRKIEEIVAAKDAVDKDDESSDEEKIDDNPTLLDDLSRKPRG